MTPTPRQLQAAELALLHPGWCTMPQNASPVVMTQLQPLQSTADGEVAQLVGLIRQIALAWEPDACLLGNMTAGQLARAADLLEHQPPQPTRRQIMMLAQELDLRDLDGSVRLVEEAFRRWGHQDKS